MNELASIKDKNNIHKSINNSDIDIDDLSKIKILNLENIISILKLRFCHNKIYTYLGDILISINPFKSLENMYHLNCLINVTLPHIYSLSEKAYTNLSKKNQSIIVSGESGSGKTENTKHILNYLCKHYSKNNSLSDKIIASSYIIEMFGNAKTIKNKNSSRFGKLISILVNEHNITGGYITDYLLEKSRVTSISEKEQSYHIFYHIDQKFLDKYNFKENYKCFKNTNVIKILNFNHCMSLLDYFQFSKYELECIFTKIKIILELNEIVYDNNLDNIHNIENELDFLGIKKRELIDMLTFKSLVINSENIKKMYDFQERNTVLNSYCQDTYQILFNDVIHKINKSIETNKFQSKINILDIFGFEILETNGLDQLCINYANEILQNLYNDLIFKKEQEVYIEERINWKYINFNDNSNIINLFHSKNSIFSIINSQCILNSNKDSIIYSNLVSNLNNNTNFVVCKKNFSQNMFSINHYAGKVEYTVKDYYLKNKIKSKDRKIKTNLNLFCKQMNELTNELKKTKISFIRCIKPNDTSVPDDFIIDKIHQQLLHSGIIEGIKIISDGFPVKLNIFELNIYFKYLKYYHKDLLQFIQNHYKFKNDYVIGASKIFLKNHIYDNLVKLNFNYSNEISSILIKYVRRFLTKKKYQLFKESIILIQSIIRKRQSKNNYNQYLRNYHGKKILNFFKWSVRILRNLRLLKKIVKIQSIFRMFSKKKKYSIPNNNNNIIQNVNPKDIRNFISKSDHDQIIYEKDQHIKILEEKLFNLESKKYDSKLVNNIVSNTINNTYICNNSDFKDNNMINTQKLDMINKKIEDLYAKMNSQKMNIISKNYIIDNIYDKFLKEKRGLTSLTNLIKSKLT